MLYYSIQRNHHGGTGYDENEKSRHSRSHQTIERNESPYQLRLYREYRIKARRDQRAREEYVRDEGIEIGIEKGINALIETCQDMGMSKDNTAEQIAKKFTLPADSVSQMIQKYWR